MKHLAFVGAVIALAAGTALAGPVPQGSGVPGNSWTQIWTYAAPADLIGARVIGSTFQNPGQDNFRYNTVPQTPIPWNEVNLLDGSTVSVAQGPTLLDNTWWDMHFSTDIAVAFTLEWAIFDGNNVLFMGAYRWTGSNWDYSAVQTTWNPTRQELLIPLPSAGLTGLAGLLVVGGLRRRR